jgi:hypothetical protein
MLEKHLASSCRRSIPARRPSAPSAASAAVVAAACALFLAGAARPAAAALAENGPPTVLHRLSAPVLVDGDISDSAWQDAATVEQWWETNPGDNVEPSVKNRAWMGYDDEYLYAAFEFDDSEPGAIRAPLGDRDDVGSPTDYGGLILDPRGDGKTAQMFLANARGIQYDALTSDDAGEDSAPDFFWEAAGKITATGWQLELRVPFSSIRYVDPNPKNWGVLLYRNHPRAYRQQYFSSRLPRDRNCFICNSRELTGLAGLPTGGHWVIAPFATSSQVAEPRGDLGTPLRTDDAEADGGIDVKWLPNPDLVIDATLNPDFSQIESDTAQITANERFALFLPEKRPFFLESVDLFSTPIQAVYTRAFNAPRWGGRATGTSAKDKYTILVGEDRGGGVTILPGPESSDLADIDFESTVALGRYRHDFGKAFVGAVYAGREVGDGGSAWNRVLGPDFEWRPNGQHTIRGQFLWSDTRTPNRTDLADTWDGRELSGYAGDAWWNFSDGKWDTFLEYKEIDDDFRADTGFVPQVGYRLTYYEAGRTVRPKDQPIRRIRVFTYGQTEEALDGRTLRRLIVPGFGLDAPLSTFFRLEFPRDEIRSGDRLFERQRVQVQVDMRPSRLLNRVLFTAIYGDDVDFAESRPGTGGTVTLDTSWRIGSHLAIATTMNRRWLDLERVPVGADDRLFTANVFRLRGVYTWNSRMWLRTVAQWVETERDQRLFTDEVDAKSGGLAGSMVFAYKLNWQTVLYVGFADNRSLLAQPADDRGHVASQLEPQNRQVFLKLSYAFRD